MTVQQAVKAMTRSQEGARDLWVALQSTAPTTALHASLDSVLLHPSATARTGHVGQ